MNDKKLADKVVALGVGSHCSPSWVVPDQFFILDTGPIEAGAFVTDWRVAGALMEKCDDIRCLHDVMHELNFREHAHYPLPRSIIEACVDALS